MDQRPFWVLYPRLKYVSGLVLSTFYLTFYSQNEHTVQIYSDLHTHFAIQEEFRRFADPQSKSMTVLCDNEHEMFLQALSTVVHYSAQAANLAKNRPNASEADCRLAWDGIVDAIMAVGSENLAVR